NPFGNDKEEEEEGGGKGGHKTPRNNNTKRIVVSLSDDEEEMGSTTALPFITNTTNNSDTVIRTDKRINSAPLRNLSNDVKSVNDNTSSSFTYSLTPYPTRIAPYSSSIATTPTYAPLHA